MQLKNTSCKLSNPILYEERRIQLRMHAPVRLLMHDGGQPGLDIRIDPRALERKCQTLLRRYFVLGLWLPARVVRPVLPRPRLIRRRSKLARTESEP